MVLEQIYAIGGKDKSGVLDIVEIHRRDVGVHDVHIKVEYCGICHSDYHTVKGDWGPVKFSCVPGHESDCGIVDKVGDAVTKFKVGDIAGVGCYVDTCRKCPDCVSSLSQYCRKLIWTYASDFKDGTSESYTLGGYSQSIVVDENYVISIPKNLDLAAAAPLLCAGITTWSPLKHYGVKAGDQVGILGLGGLGHMGVKFAKALGAVVTVISRSASKNDVALKLGADRILITTDEAAFKAAYGSLNFILDTVAAEHDVEEYTRLLDRDGTLILVGLSPVPFKLSAFTLASRRIKVGGSQIGSIKETQEMMDFCGKHNIVSDIELVDVNYSNHAYERMVKSDVQFRFVLDIGRTLKKESKVDPPSSSSGILLPHH